MLYNFAKKSKHKLIRQYRQITWRNRPLPDFIIIGAQRSGTSSLYSHLSQHPQLLPSFKKEVHFFDGGLDPLIDNFKKGQAWYRSNFPLKIKNKTDCKMFEASPLYLFNPLVPKRIFDLIPKVKLIIMLRNPTDRAISQYFHEKSINKEFLSISQALQKEEERLRPSLETKDYKNPAFIHYSYKARGLYKEQLERYLKYFPWKQILIIKSKQLFTETNTALKQIFDFLGVNPEFKVKTSVHPNSSYSKNAISPDIYEYLNNYFSSPNQALSELVRKIIVDDIF